MHEWLAIGVGLAGGLLVCYHVARLALPPLVERSKNPDLVIRLSFGGALIAVLPALLLSIVVAGVAAVFSVTLLLGILAGALLARYLR
jgi:hypothetical protein